MNLGSEGIAGTTAATAAAVVAAAAATIGSSGSNNRLQPTSKSSGKSCNLCRQRRGQSTYTTVMRQPMLVLEP